MGHLAGSSGSSEDSGGGLLGASSVGTTRPVGKGAASSVAMRERPRPPGELSVGEKALQKPS